MSTTLRDEAAVRRIANRLKRAQGQLAALIAAVEAGADCRDVVTQLAAVSGAIDRAGFAVIATAMQQCAEDDDSEVQMAELEKLFLSLS